jgi:Domain of unknown function (DUF4260)
MTTMHGAMDQAATSSATVRGWLRLEAAAVFLAGLAAYGWLGGPWLLAIPLLLLPDLSAVGYVRDPRVGAFTYNLVHNWAFGLGLLAIGLAAGSTPLEILGTIAIAHTGMDRAVGYGLKLPTSFHDTHLGRMGKDK